MDESKRSNSHPVQPAALVALGDRDHRKVDGRDAARPRGILRQMTGEVVAVERMGIQRIIAQNGGPVLGGHPHPREISRVVFPGSPFEKVVEPDGLARKSRAIVGGRIKRGEADPFAHGLSRHATPVLCSASA